MKYFISCFLLSCLCASYSWDISQSQSNVDSAIVDLYNYNFDLSLELLDKAQKIDPNHPVIPFLKTTAIWLKIQTDVGHEESYKALKSSFDESIPIYQKLIKENPENPEYYLYLGSLYGLLTRIELGYGHWFKALLPTIRGYKYIKKSNSLDPNLYDSYTPIGMSIYYICLNNDFIRYSSSVLGFNTNCDISIEYLEIGSIQSYYSWIEANNALSYIYLYIERDYQSSENKIDILINKFPNNPFYHFIKAEILCRGKRWDEYMDLRPTLVKMSNHQSKIIRDECTLKLRYLDANKYYNDRQYDIAIKLLTNNINTYNMEFDWLLGLSYYLRAKSYIELNDQANAKKDLLVVSKMDFFFPEIEESKELLAKFF